jgi:hypothetical protein
MCGEEDAGILPSDYFGGGDAFEDCQSLAEAGICNRYTSIPIA